MTLLKGATVTLKKGKTMWWSGGTDIKAKQSSKILKKKKLGKMTVISYRDHRMHNAASMLF